MQPQQAAQQQGGTLTITEQLVQQKMFQKLQPNEQSIITRVYQAGMKILFSPQTHQQMVSEFEQQLQKGVDVGQLIGTDMAHIMIVLWNESKGTMPKGALIPAGTLLVAKACEFLKDDSIAPVTDANFSSAVHVMTSALMAKFDPKFAATMQSAQAPATAPTQPQPPASGMLSQGA